LQKSIPKPVRRSALRRFLGHKYYACKRYALWARMRGYVCTERRREDLPYAAAEHRTPLVRNLKSVDMWMQRNKVTNLKIAVSQIDGILLRPGEVFSYWKLIGKPTKQKGYVDGMVLKNGTVTAGTGGGLCQLSNLIFWMTAHTPLTIVERHRHGYDVFPDSNRTQPFGSGATCYYPHGDLMLRNDTEHTFQILVTVGTDYLEGALLASDPIPEKYCVVEKNHRMESEYWGAYSRHNELHQEVYAPDGQLLRSQLLVENHALMMYSPFLDAAPTSFPEEKQ